MKGIVFHRRALHRLAEPGFCEFQTGEYLQGVLSECGADMKKLGETGIAAYFDFGKSRTAAFRAEMDALPLTEKTGLPFSCRSGFMHACGHDGHMAILLGMAQECSSGFLPDKNVLLIFQPAEELCGGAESVIASGIFDSVRPDEMYALHLRGGLEKGSIFSRAGIICAGSREIDVTFSGSYAHIEEKKSDAMISAAEFLLSAEKSLKDCGFVGFGKLTAGIARNAVAGEAALFGTQRYFYEKEKFQAEKTLSGLAEKSACRCEIVLRDYSPPLENAAAIFSSAEEKIKVNVLPSPLLCADDFSLYSNVCKILYLLLGAGNVPPLHSDCFDFDESILSGGEKALMSLLKNS